MANLSRDAGIANCYLLIAAAEITRSPDLSRLAVDHPIFFEEVRARMNTALGECIHHLETERGNALEGPHARTLKN